MTTNRGAGALGSLVLVLGLLGGCGGGETEPRPAVPTGRTVPTAAALGAAAWLSGELEGGLLVGEYGPDHGLSIDAALGLAELPGQDQAVDAVAEAVAADLAGYTTGAAMGNEDVYAGSVAKAAVLALTAGADPRAFGGTDLVAGLEGLVADGGLLAGRLADDVVDPNGTDYANVIGQAYAVRALAAAGSSEADAATEFLLAQQCGDGWFRLYFAPPGQARQECDAGRAEQSLPDTDVTALAVLALEEVGTEAAEEAAGRAADWLVETQGQDGGFAGATSTEGVNANSTGLAGWALMAVGRTDEAGAAAAWLGRRQVTDVACGATDTEPLTGAVAYDDAALDRGSRGPADLDQWRRATAQAAPVLLLAGEPAGEVVVEISGNTAEIAGLTAGEQACLRGPDGFAARVQGTEEPVRVELGSAAGSDLVLHRLAGRVPVEAGG